MKQKKTPMRMCVGCREMKPKRDLVRLVRTKEGTILLDKTGKASGRGAYICQSRACLERALKIRAVEHALDTRVPPETVQALMEAFEQVE
nr:YlxR family protein [Maliibacterium massiliense]